MILIITSDPQPHQTTFLHPHNFQEERRALVMHQRQVAVRDEVAAVAKFKVSPSAGMDVKKAFKVEPSNQIWWSPRRHLAPVVNCTQAVTC